MKTLGVIPARYESSRYPGKPLAKIFGRPMIEWVYHNAKSVKELDEVVVATDDIRIQQYCDLKDINVIMTSSKHQCGTDRVAEVSDSIDADYYINIQGDEPIASPNVIREVIDEFPIVNLMSECREEDLEDMTIPKVATTDNSIALYYSRLPIPYQKGQTKPIHMKQIGIYSLDRDMLLMFNSIPMSHLEKVEGIEFLRFIEWGIPVKMKEVKYDTISVDVPEDIKKVEEHLYSKYSAIVFDLDGVILDSVKIKREGFEQIFPGMYIDLNTGGKTRYDKIKHFYLNEKNDTIPRDVYERLCRQYDEYTRKRVIESKVSEDILILIKNSNFNFYIVSGTPTEILVDILKKKKLLKYFKSVYGCDDKPKSKILEEINESEKSMIYIGDTKNDEEEASYADVPFKRYVYGKNEIWEIFQ